jgi:hypothetical protein
MKWTKGNTEGFESIKCVNEDKETYIVNISPTEYRDDRGNYNIKFVNFLINHEPTTYELNSLLTSVQKDYDTSNEVNGFYIGDKVVWLDKATRVGLINSLNIQKEQGLTNSDLWLDGTSYNVEIDTALEFLKKLELYAIDCYNITQSHLAEIEGLTKREDILNYDVTKGYPEKLKFQ